MVMESSLLIYNSELLRIEICDLELNLFFRFVDVHDGNILKNKKVGSITYLLSLKLTNLTKPKLMKKNVIQIYCMQF